MRWLGISYDHIMENQLPSFHHQELSIHIMWLSWSYDHPFVWKTIIRNIIIEPKRTPVLVFHAKDRHETSQQTVLSTWLTTDH